MKRIISFILLVGVMLTLLCSCSGDSKFVGTWHCDEWVSLQGTKYHNAKIVLNDDGTGSIKNGEEWATYKLTWEEISENSILIYEEHLDGGSPGAEYRYEEIVGVPHLIFDNGSVHKDFYKQ